MITAEEQMGCGVDSKSYYSKLFLDDRDNTKVKREHSSHEFTS